MPEQTSTSDQFHSVSTSSIRLGAILRMPISDERGVLLLSAGQKITSEFYDHLRTRQIDSLRVHEQDLPYVMAGYAQGMATAGLEDRTGLTSSEENRATRTLDNLLDNPASLALPPQGEAFAASVPPPPRTAFSEEQRQEFIEHQEQSVDQVQDIFHRLLTGSGLDLDSLSTITDQALEDLTEDCDLFASLGLNPLSKDYPARHSLHTTMLGVSIGMNLRLDRVTLRELAVGCLIHDAGMLKINQQFSQLSRELTRIEFLEITKHPVRIFDMVREIEQISNRSAFIAYQMHERNDGSGYPRGRQGGQIHFLSKVAAVADVYCALVTPRQYRPALQPHFAIEKVVSMGNAGVLDATAIRALLETTSMYPIGSYVLLSDDRVARTIRSNGREFDSPVVEAWDPARLNDPPEIIDLMHAGEIYIICSIPTLDCDLTRYKTEGQSASSSTLQILELVDLADQCLSDDIKKQRATPRFQYRQPVTVHFQLEGQNDADLLAHTFQGRNLSGGGVSILGDRADLPREVVVNLQNATNEPIYLRAEIVRREHIRDNWYEYGLHFLGRTSHPLPKAS